MRKRQQKTASKKVVRYQRQETWSKNHEAALHDRLHYRRKKEKRPFNKK